MNLTDKTTNGERLEQLQTLLLILAEKIDSGPGARDLSQLAKQYRETAAEIAQLTALEPNDDIAAILEERKAAGMPGAVRDPRN